MEPTLENSIDLAHDDSDIWDYCGVTLVHHERNNRDVILAFDANTEKWLFTTEAPIEEQLWDMLAHCYNSTEVLLWVTEEQTKAKLEYLYFNQN